MDLQHRLYLTTRGPSRHRRYGLFRANLSLNWTGRFKMLMVGHALAESAPDGRPLTAKLLYLDLPNDMPGMNTACRVLVVRYKPCANPHDISDLPRFLPAGLTPYVLYNYTSKSTPYHATEDDVTSSFDPLEVEKITSHQSGRGRDAVIVVLYETHWKGFLGARDGPPALQAARYSLLGRHTTSTSTGQSVVPPHARWCCPARTPARSGRPR